MESQQSMLLSSMLQLKSEDQDMPPSLQNSLMSAGRLPRRKSTLAQVIMLSRRESSLYCKHPQCADLLFSLRLALLP